MPLLYVLELFCTLNWIYACLGVSSFLKKSLFYGRLVRDPRANYKQSLEVLKHVKRIQQNMVTKSSLMLGLGETDDEVFQAMKGKHYLIQINSPFLVNCFFKKTVELNCNCSQKGKFLIATVRKYRPSSGKS